MIREDQELPGQYVLSIGKCKLIIVYLPEDMSLNKHSSMLEMGKVAASYLVYVVFQHSLGKQRENS